LLPFHGLFAPPKRSDVITSAQLLLSYNDRSGT
jgi:hypothetical protein